MMADLERNLFECIRSSGYVRVDADNSLVCVTPRSQT
jgi:hypothetical protein